MSHSNSSSSNSTSQKAVKGVADYFAILGIGDTLTLQSFQKKLAKTNATSQDIELLQQEEECLMMQRFYREIVEIGILTVYDGSCVNCPSYVHQQQQPRVAAAILSKSNRREMEKEDDNEDDYPLHEHSLQQENLNVETDLFLLRRKVNDGSNFPFHLPQEVAGYEMLYQTAAASHPMQHLCQQQNGQDLQMSMSINMSLSINTTFDQNMNTTGNGDSHPLASVWNKNDTFDGNLDPIHGLRGTLVEKLPNVNATFMSDAQGANQSILGSTFDSIDQRGSTSIDEVTIDSSSSGLLSRFSKPTISKLKNKITSTIQKKTQALEPTIAPSTITSPGSDVPEVPQVADIPIQQKRYYIGFRKRGPDETHKPGIAECTLVYVKIHKQTILREYNNLGQRMNLLTNHFDPTHHGQDEDDDLSQMTMNTTVSRRERLQKLAVGATGLAGGLAKKVKQQSVEAYRNHMNKSTSFEEEDNCCLDRDVPSENDDKKETTDKDWFENIPCDRVQLEQLIDLPLGFTEWVIPDMYQTLRLPVPPSPSRRKHLESPFKSPRSNKSSPYKSPRSPGNKVSSGDKRMQKTFLFHHKDDLPNPADAGIGVEAFVDGNTFLHPTRKHKSPKNAKKRNPWSPTDSPPRGFNPTSSYLFEENREKENEVTFDREVLMPMVIDSHDFNELKGLDLKDVPYEYIPLVAVRRQRVGVEERFHEDPSMVDLAVSFVGASKKPVMPNDDDDDFELTEEDEDPISSTSEWKACNTQEILLMEEDEEDEDHPITDESRIEEDMLNFGMPSMICKRNLPMGFLDTPFATSVLDRFPKKDYKGVPLPEEELPMFCYPTGCKLFRARYQDAPLPENYGFSVKNERGDSIHVSCVSFMEPLEKSKIKQLNEMSRKRMLTSLPHRYFCESQDFANKNTTEIDDKSSLMMGFDEMNKREMVDDLFYGFDEMMTFEYKTICLIGRYPYWSAFRKYLSHLHILSGSSSDLPLERYISHLLMAVPVPKPGGQYILVPLPAIASPMVLGLPPLKDLPLLDFSYRRLFGCLDVPTVVAIVLGFLALERKVIIMSAYPSLVSDVCELLRSLLFPFDLCAPYVPRLTEPFMSCLNFPGAIFVGIHDDGSPKGLAASVRRNIPEDSFIVDLDTGDIDCAGDRLELLKECWEIIPSQARSSLVEEIETLCQDARIEPGQEPTGPAIEAALDIADVTFAPVFDGDTYIQLDDRAVRDSFLRFFCFVLSGYERFLMVPDIDFLVSGNEWFDSKGFLSITEKQSRGRFLQTFVTTQLFQSFIQRRTEASDVHCLLFDECLHEYNSSQEPYGRLVESKDLGESSKGSMAKYDLLVDQCAAEMTSSIVEGEESSADASTLTPIDMEGFMINNSGDLVTAPSKKNLPSNSRYVYCLDGHPHFPQELDTEMFYPHEPAVLTTDFDSTPVPILTRSEREKDVSNMRKNTAVSRRGVQRQRRCLFQLPKLLASHVLNTWLMCIPAQVSQEFQSVDQQNTYLMRALGALRLLRSRNRIVPDEAGYRCLIIACGRVDSDRRQDVVKLFGLLRSDGIFPSAVTLGQYTRAIAEGYSKQSTGASNSIIGEYNDPNLAPLEDNDINLDSPNALDFLDGSLKELDEIGSKWRQSREARKREKIKKWKEMREKASVEEDSKADSKNDNNWIPVTSSSSFSPHWKPSSDIDLAFDLVHDFRFIALWSRTTSCARCNHVLLDEEIQAGWDDENQSEDGESNDILCPCCGNSVSPRLGFLELPPDTRGNLLMSCNGDLPPQVKNQTNLENENNDDRFGYVPYLNPSQMRYRLEKIVEDFGEDVLDREKLRYLNPTVFFNLWWFCCRFSLPLPLAISKISGGEDPNEGAQVYNNHCCAFAAWDKSIALAACQSAAKGILSLQNIIRKCYRPEAKTEFKNIIKAFGGDDPNGINFNFLTNPNPLLANLDLKSIGQGDWENEDLLPILVKLVEACDKRDFVPAVKAVMQCNLERISKFGRGPNVELDCYRTLLYLARYQCTSAFHTFFPTTSKTCKGYHFWCPNSTVPIFDRMFREAVSRSNMELAKLHDVSDVALGMRTVFGHLI